MNNFDKKLLRHLGTLIHIPLKDLEAYFNELWC